MAEKRELTAVDADMIILDIEGKLQKLDGRTGTKGRCTIFRVPDHISRGREELFRPFMVSIGPYHHGKKELKEMQPVKLQFLRELKDQTSGDFLKTCIGELMRLEKTARSRYFNSVDFKPREFVEMLLLDGCFIVLMLIKMKEETFSDTYGKVYWHQNMIIHDLFLMENQIPYFVLQPLFDLISQARGITTITLHQMVVNFLMTSKELTTKLPEAHEFRSDICHMLHLCHFCYTHRRSQAISPSHGNFLRRLVLNPARLLFSLICRSRAKDMTIMTTPSATRLVEAGVTFRKKMVSNNFLDVDFKDGVLEIPSITINEETAYRLANLVLLEQCGDMGTDITSYASFMDDVIDTPDDVEILRRGEILEKMMPTNEDMAKFFNQLCVYMVIQDKHYLSDVLNEVDDYCSLNWNEQRARLARDYFSNPWAFISMVAAAVLLILTFIQAAFSVISYFKPPS